ncbi:Major facilitator superfamily [Artemisia annua]|uniref:Major facilitator superfamily n=1 Tax=Artemisia annua TaxID=35608 RepID=A0A2U1Q621_ARTAN|nr:Major facilitator superfamily [Artemisia annua]
MAFRTATIHLLYRVKADIMKQVFYLASALQILAVFVTPSFRNIVSKQVGPTEQGKAQGCITGLNSLPGIIPPLVFSHLTGERNASNICCFMIRLILANKGASRKADKATIIADMDGRVYGAMTASAAPNQEACSVNLMKLSSAFLQVIMVLTRRFGGVEAYEIAGLRKGRFECKSAISSRNVEKNNMSRPQMALHKDTYSPRTSTLVCTVNGLIWNESNLKWIKQSIVLSADKLFGQEQVTKYKYQLVSHSWFKGGQHSINDDKILLKYS